MNTQINSLELIEIYKGIEIYKHYNQILAPIYNVFWLNGKECSRPNITLAKCDITRHLEKKNKNK